MALLFDGSSYIQSAINYTRTSTDHTVMFWCRLDDSSGGNRPIGNTGQWEGRTSSGSTTLISDFLESGTSTQVVLTLGQWHHVAFVEDINNTSKTAYLDGVPVSFVGGTHTGTTTGFMHVGASPGSISQGWKGALDDIRIYDRVLGDGEIETIYATCGTDGIMEGLSHQWTMDEGVEGSIVNTIIDVVGGLDCSVVTGSPSYEYTSGLKHRRVT